MFCHIDTTKVQALIVINKFIPSFFVNFLNFINCKVTRKFCLRYLATIKPIF